MNICELQDYLIEEAEYNEERVKRMSKYQLVDAYLKYNGIIGYTRDILEVVECAYGVELD